MKWHNLQSYIGTLDEFRRAIEDGAYIKALRIRTANPTLTHKFDLIETRLNHGMDAGIHLVA